MAPGRKPGCAKVGAGVYELAKNNSEPLDAGWDLARLPWEGAAARPLPGRAALAARHPGAVPGRPCHSAPGQGGQARTKVPGVRSCRSCGARPSPLTPEADPLTVNEAFYLCLCLAVLMVVPGNYVFRRKTGSKRDVILNHLVIVRQRLGYPKLGESSF